MAEIGAPSSISPRTSAVMPHSVLGTEKYKEGNQKGNRKKKKISKKKPPHSGVNSHIDEYA